MTTTVLAFDDNIFWMCAVAGILILLGMIISNLGAVSMVTAYKNMKSGSKGKRGGSRKSMSKNSGCSGNGWMRGLMILGPLLYLAGWIWMIVNFYTYAHEDWQKWVLLISGVVIVLTAMYLVNARMYRWFNMGNKGWGAMYWLCLLLFIAGWVTIGIVISVMVDNWWAILIPTMVLLGLVLLEIRMAMGWNVGLGLVMYAIGLFLIAYFMSVSEFSPF